MLKVVVGGIAVGMANIIPGVSGGTMMVILGMYSRVMDAINGITSRDKKERNKHIIFLLTLIAGVLIGLVAFANLMVFLFEHYPTQTMFCFVGMVAFSIPSLVKKEMSGDRFEIIPFAIGCAIIFVIGYFAPEKIDMVITDFPKIELSYLLLMVVIGFIAGFTMFVPGVSGSMILLIIGQYYLFNSLVASVKTLQIDVLIPLAFMGVGILSGIFASSKLTGLCLKKSHSKTMNFILGLVVASSVVLIPFSAKFDLPLILTSILGLAIGTGIVLALEKIGN